MNNSSVEIRDAILPDDLAEVQKLWFDYLVWGNNQMQSLYGVHPHNPKEAVEEDIRLVNKFLPPNGRLLLAFVDKKACGMGAIQTFALGVRSSSTMAGNC